MQDKKKKYRIGVALSGGGAKGFAHLGALKALEEHGVAIDVISGNSAGALIGALYADGYTPEEILSFFDGSDFRDFAEFQLPREGIFSTKGFSSFMSDHLKADTFEDLKTPLRIVVTNIEEGRSVTFDKGRLVDVVVASCSMPLVLNPVLIDGVHYVDGGLFKNFPVSTIRKDCDFVIGINVSPIVNEPYRPSLLYIAERSYNYLFRANMEKDRQICDLLIEDNAVAKYQVFDLDGKEKLFDIGYHAAKKALKNNELLIQE